MWIAITSLANSALAKSYTIKSPNKRLSFQKNNNQQGLSYAVTLNNNTIIESSALRLIIDNINTGNSEMLLLGQQKNR